MGKTVITSTGKDINSSFDRRFGRAGWFCIHDDETGVTDFIENKNFNAGHGAGTRAAEVMAAAGVTKVISGDFGPKAKSLLDRLGIQMVIIDDENSSVGDVLRRMGGLGRR